MARDLELLGADGILSVTPYYNKPTQEGLYQHYRAIAGATGLPILVYSVKSRTGVNVEPATLRRLAEIDNIAGVKEASGDIGQMARVCQEVPERFAVLSGDDSITIPLMALGGRGVISVASNEIPAEMTRLVRLCLENRYPEAREIQRKYLSLMDVNFIETNPGPVKAGLALMGLIEPVWRLPMVPPKPESMARIEKVLAEVGLLERQTVHAG
jgi:4-hydroxy-tetrahydrodipicolinate synthase